MTYKIAKSATASLGDFAARAAAHAVEMKNWRAHMRRVADDEAAGVTGIDRHMAHPRPAEHELVQAAVNERDEMDYEIVDDGPTAEQLLEQKKAELFRQVSMVEQEAIRAIVPPAKLRLLNIRENDIRLADAALAEKLLKKRSIVGKMAAAVGLVEPVDIPAAVEKARSEEDTNHLHGQSERRSRADAIYRVAAQAHHDIDDLTADNIDSWQLPDFK